MNVVGKRVGVAVAAILAAACGSAEAPETEREVSAPAETGADATMDAGCPILASRDWAAWVDSLPGPDSGPQLHVAGQIDLPVPDYSVAWSEGPMDRRAPPSLRLNLELTPPEGMVAQVVTAVDVKYSGPASQPEYRSIVVGCGTRAVAEITEIAQTN